MCQKRKLVISQLRKRFLTLNIHAIIIPSADPHQSEYLADHWKIREWISSFTGSSGTLVITRHTAGLWTDSRYFLQAEGELNGGEIILHRMGESDVLTPIQYLIKNLAEGDSIALNPIMWSHKAIIDIEEEIKETGLHLDLDHRIAEEIWNNEKRPALHTKPLFIHEPIYAGQSVTVKLNQVRDQMIDHEVQQHLITTLDDIAWLFNLRGHNIDFNPVFMAYCIVRKEDAILFVDQKKINKNIEKHLTQAGVIIKTYEEIGPYLFKTSQSILINPNDCNEDLYKTTDGDLITEGPTLTRLLKACKTTREIEHIDNVMIRDGIALAHAFYQLYQQLGKITEAEFAHLMATKRSKQANYYGESFPAIVGYQANGAIVHYRPKVGQSAIIKAEGLLLCDSGGQYLDGTTDITRTIAVGSISKEQVESYTRVLKGHIAIDLAVFPIGTTGGTLDILARQHLWQNGQNYGHGTGHGVGYFLNVHEPPQGISQSKGSRAMTELKVGMLTSNEPGYYEEGSYGIRIENLIIAEESEYVGYLKHRHITLFPIDTSFLIHGMLTKDEVQWINDYHDLVASKLIPHLDGKVKEWMKISCSKI